MGAPLNHIDPRGTDVYAGGVGGSYFLGALSPNEPPRGYAAEGSIGIAYDSNTGELAVYVNSGNTGPTGGYVSGIGAGPGFAGANVKGSMEDFLGESREESATFAFFSGGRTKTPSGVEGVVWAAGGKGWGWGGTIMSTRTRALIRLRPSPCPGGDPGWPQLPAPWAP
jgi:hypothetical protein